jgi:hypothetical protein
VVDFLAAGAIDVSPLLTEVVPLAEAVRAFDLASDRARAMKSAALPLTISLPMGFTCSHCRVGPSP